MFGGGQTGRMGMGSKAGCGAGRRGRRGMPGGQARGLRGGRGHRHMFFATGLPGWMRVGAAGGESATGTDSTESAQQVLRDQIDTLQAQLEAAKRRLAELQAADAAR